MFAVSTHSQSFPRIAHESASFSGVIKEKKSSDLFVYDVTRGRDNLKKSSGQFKKRLRADEIISQRSSVPAVSIRKRSGDKTTDGLVAVKRPRTDWTPHKELARLRRVADGHRKTIVEAKDADYDIWDTAPDSSGCLSRPFLPELPRAKQPKSMKQPPVSLTSSGKHTRAVQRPSGGYSYNPAFSDYEKRLAEESTKALKAEEQRLALEEADRRKREAAARSAAEAEAAEKRADLSEWEEDSEWEGLQSGLEDDRPKVKLLKRKTQAQRNRIKRRKEEERLAKEKAALKKRRLQEQQIKQIAQELDEEDEKKSLSLVKESDTDSEVDDDKLRRKQLGKFKLPEKDLELVLPDELQESLRLLKPEGNLLKDRYRSMLVRGKVESRRHIPFKKQAKKKLTEKWTQKDFVL